MGHETLTQSINQFLTINVFSMQPLHVRLSCVVFIFKEFVFIFRDWWKGWVMYRRGRLSSGWVIATHGQRWSLTWTDRTTWLYKPSVFSINSTRTSTRFQCASGMLSIYDNRIVNLFGQWRGLCGRSGRRGPGSGSGRGWTTGADRLRSWV